MIIFANPPLEEMLVELAKRGCDAPGFMYPKTAAVLRDGKLAAVAVYHDYHPPSDIQMSFYALTPRWAHHSTIRDLLAYPFIQLGVRRITALIKRSNRRSRRMVEGLGWKLEGVLRQATRDGENICIYGLLAKDFGERYGKAKSTFSTAGGHDGTAVPAPGSIHSGCGPAYAWRWQAGAAGSLAAGAHESDRSASGIQSGAEPALSRTAGELAHGWAQNHDAGRNQQRLRIVRNG